MPPRLTILLRQSCWGNVSVKRRSCRRYAVRVGAVHLSIQYRRHVMGIHRIRFVEMSMALVVAIVVWCVAILTVSSTPHAVVRYRCGPQQVVVSCRSGYSQTMPAHSSGKIRGADFGKCPGDFPFKCAKETETPCAGELCRPENTYPQCVSNNEYSDPGNCQNWSPGVNENPDYCQNLSPDCDMGLVGKACTCEM
jgi:hypothetical protein